MRDFHTVYEYFLQQTVAKNKNNQAAQVKPNQSRSTPVVHTHICPTNPLYITN